MATYYLSKISGTLRYKVDAWPSASDAAIASIGAALTAIAAGDTLVLDGGVGGQTYIAADLYATTGTQIARDNQVLRTAISSDPDFAVHIGKVIFDGTGLASYCASINAVGVTLQGMALTGSNAANPAFRVNNKIGAIINDVEVYSVPFGFATISAAGFTMNRCLFRDLTGVSGDASQVMDLRGVNAAAQTLNFNNCRFENCAGFIRCIEDSKYTINFNNCAFNGFKAEVLRLLSTGISHTINFNNCTLDNVAFTATSTTTKLMLNQAYSGGGRINVRNTALCNTKFWVAPSWPIAGIADGGGNVFLPPKYVRPSKKGIIIIGTDDWYMPDDPTPGSYAGQDPEYHLKLGLLCSERGIRMTSAIPIKGLDSDKWDDIALLASRGHELASHTMSHPRLTNLDALVISYSGPGTAATLTKNGDIVTTSITGAPENNLSINLTDYHLVQDLKNYIAGESAKGYACGYAVDAPQYTISSNMADVSAQDIYSDYTWQVDPDDFYAYELWTSRQTIEAEVNARYPSLGYQCRTFVHPNDDTDATVREYLTLYYDGARGKNADNSYDLTAGVRLYGVWDMYIPQFFGDSGDFNGLSDDEVRRRISALCAWLNYTGAIVLIYAHQVSEVSLEKWAVVLDVIAGSNCDTMTLGEAVDFLKTGTASGEGGEVKYSVPQVANPDYHLAKGSPCIRSGIDVGLTTDADGVTIPTGAGFDIGPYFYKPEVDSGFSPWCKCDSALPLSAQPCKSHALPIGTRKVTAFTGVATAAQINEAAE